MKRPRSETQRTRVKTGITGWAQWLTTLGTVGSLPIGGVLGQVPGLVHTESGYDNIEGDDAICWSAPRFFSQADVSLRGRSLQDFQGQQWKNALVPQFIAGPTTMLARCPTGTSLTLDLMSKATHGSSKLRTHQYYTFHIALDIDLDVIRADLNLSPDAFFYSHKAQEGKSGFTHPQIALQLDFCPINGNLCTPFMFEGLLAEDDEGLNQLQVGKVENRNEGQPPPPGGSSNGLGPPPPPPPPHHDFQHNGNVIEHNQETTGAHNHDNHNHERGRKLRGINNNRNNNNGNNNWWRDLLTTFTIIEPPPEEAMEQELNNTESMGNNPEQYNDTADTIPINVQPPPIPPPPQATGDNNITFIPFHDNNLQPLPSNTNITDNLQSQPPPLPPPALGNSNISESLTQPSPPQPSMEDNHNHTPMTNEEQAKQRGMIMGAAASPEFYFEIARPDTSSTTSTSTFQIHYDVEIQVQDVGAYLPMATVMFFLTNETQERRVLPHEYPLYKIDIANLLHNRSVTFHPPIQINTISTEAAVVSYILIGICAALQLFVLVSTIYYRNENVMKLSQVGFLIALQVAALVAILSSIFFQPKNDVYCMLGGPFTLIPLQLIFAIVYGRLRRIYAIMAPLLSFNSTNNKKYLKRGFRNWRKTFMMGSISHGSSSDNNPSATSTTEHAAAQEGAPPRGGHQRKSITSLLSRIPCLRCLVFEPRNSLRQQFSQTKLIIVVGLVTLPMIIWEICLIAIFSPEKHLVLNQDESVGRYECGTEATQKWQLASTGILFVTIVMDLHQAHSSKSLPAFFNEASAVSNGLATALAITAVGFAVLVVSDGPEGEPDLTYLMEVLIVLCTALNLSLRLTLPKLNLVWRGEKVVVSRIIRDHRQMEQAKSAAAADDNGGGPQISGLDTSYQGTMSRHHQSGVRRMEEGSESQSTSHNGESDLSTSISNQSTTTRPSGGGGPLPKIDEDKCIKPEQAQQSLRKRIVVQPGEAPPSKLAMQLLSHANNAKHVNEKVLSGYQVEMSDWIKLVESVDNFQALLQGYDFDDAAVGEATELMGAAAD